MTFIAIANKLDLFENFIIFSIFPGLYRTTHNRNQTSEMNLNFLFPAVSYIVTSTPSRQSSTSNKSHDA